MISTPRRPYPRATILASLSLLLFPMAASSSPSASAANRLTYLDEAPLFHPNLSFPKLATPQWAGQDGVEAVVVLAIDDMRDTAKYEAFLRPILERLKQIDGRAPVSIMANAVDPEDPQLQTWLEEGLSLEIHTLAHPCPCLQKGNFEAASDTFHGCVDLLNQIPGNAPVAYRMPCCDSMNSPSPRFYNEIFARANPAGQYLSIDSSVMNITTPRDESLPREWVLHEDGTERFRKYLPAETSDTVKVSMGSFVTTIEDYPYPYVMGKGIWEFPCAMPSDWEAHNLHGSNQPQTVADWKTALDITVRKQGVFNLIFHPHGWIRSEQILELIDHAVSEHGRKVKFLSFREASQKLQDNLLAGDSLRGAEGGDNGVRLLDLNGDGFQDVVIGRHDRKLTRVWHASSRRWKESGFPVTLDGCRFGLLDETGAAVMLKLTPESRGAWRFSDGAWIADEALLQGLEVGGRPLLTQRDGRDLGVRWRDIDHDGRCELIANSPDQQAVFAWSEAERTWTLQPYAMPKDVFIVDAAGRDNGVRFVDVNQDGFEDVLMSNAERCSLHLYVPVENKRLMWQVGWNDLVFAGRRGEGAPDIPMIVRDGPHRDNGAWFARGTMWIQNEDTAHLPDRVDRRTFEELLQADTPPPLTPEQSLAVLHARPGFKVELVAAEPLVADPVAFDWSADGRLWVVGMEDYPLGVGPEGQPGGTVRILEDTDSDGRYDRSTLFLEDLWYPSGIMAWRQGVIVAAAPEVFYAEDTDGDGRADRREVLLTGFSRGNPQHLVNGFEYGLDHWVYGANGDSGGRVSSVLQPDQEPVNIRGRDFRFRPGTGEFELIAGQTQFGRHRDDWGNWFGNNNPTWAWHYHLPEHYLKRNPHLIVRDTRRVLARYEDSGRVYPASRTRQRFNDHHHFNHVTSANSAVPYRDDLFGPEFAGSLFISDPVHNLVHREVLAADGATFTSRRASDEASIEFLASEDIWFRPTMLKTGPDGALYVADFYRLVLEHPEWIPDFMESRLRLRAGEGMGRIYRVFPEDARPRSIPNLASLGDDELAAALDTPNGWQRDTAHRLLVEDRPEAKVAGKLVDLVRSARHPAARLQALCALQGRGELKAGILRKAMTDEHPMVRARAVRLSEAFPFDTAVSSLAGDADPRVRHQLALSLGEWPQPEAGRALAELAMRRDGDENLHTAIMSSAARHHAVMLERLLEIPDHTAGSVFFLSELLSLAAAKNDMARMADVLRRVITPREGEFQTWQFQVLGALLAALDGRNTTVDDVLGAASSGSLRQEGRRELDNALQQAAHVAVDSGAALEHRLAALEVLSRPSAPSSGDARVLSGLLRTSEPLAVQEAALAAALRGRGDATADLLLSAWRNGSPSLRENLLNALLSRTSWAEAFLNRVGDGSVAPGQIGLSFRQRLLSHRDESVRRRAEELLTSAHSDRQAVLHSYAGVERLNGDAERGRALFLEHCAVCHRFRGEGTELGPDLGAVNVKSTAAWLAAILDPNQAVEWRYVPYDILTADGRELTGLVTAETPNSVTLRAVGGTEETLPRKSLERFESARLSLMPEGLEAVLPPQGMADLLAFLEGQ